MIKNFLKIVLGGFAGGICGLLAGFILSFLVAGLIALNCRLLGGCAWPGIPTEMVTIFSTGAGAILGGIFGAVFALRKIKN